MIKLRTIYELLQQQPTDWIIRSVSNPSPYMSNQCIKLHYLVLRERGVK